MKQSLTDILKIQELDMNMLRLLDLREKRNGDLEEMRNLRKDLKEQLVRKEHDVMEAKKNIKLSEAEVRDAEEKIKDLESKQQAVKKVDEFNALNKQLTETERSKVTIEHKIADMTDLLAAEEEVLNNISESLTSTEESSQNVEKEILDGVSAINVEGQALQKERDTLAKAAEPDFFKVYERLLSNKRDRVVVPVENRTCSGCHIVLTAQHENLVRKGERLVFCEHCSRIHYWPEAAAEEEGAPKRRRRKVSA